MTRLLTLALAGVLAFGASFAAGRVASGSEPARDQILQPITPAVVALDTGEPAGTRLPDLRPPKPRPRDPADPLPGCCAPPVDVPPLPPTDPVEPAPDPQPRPELEPGEDPPVIGGS